MLVMGLSGGPSLIFENQLELDFNMFHDAAAVLIEDGKVIAAVEEERLNRIKHTNKAPVLAINSCLKKCKKKLSDLDKIAIYFDYNTYEYISYKLQYHCLKDYKDYIVRFLEFEFNEKVEKNKIVFVPHHYAHAESAFQLSGFNEALVVTLDGVGDNSSGLIISRKKDQSELLHEFSISDSLGLFYLDITRFLGYDLFDEYKVMGLSSYGNPSIYRRLFKRFYKLLPNGNYTINHIYLQLLNKITRPREKGEPITKVHKDIAAALQETLETIVLHILTQYQKSTGHKNLCLAGGVAHNCSCNGKILYADIFESVFVQPAAHDAGCALGAALFISKSNNFKSLDHIFWGTTIDNDINIISCLECWNRFITWEHMSNRSEEVALLLANKNIIGWIQGCAEFGPRALGNRSILADPRPIENKDIVNFMIKKRESYRPFAPAIMIEHLDEYFDCPNTKCNFSFMNYVINVKKDMKKKLGAVTHIDGTARIQTVSKNTNPEFWNLINSFKSITGIPVLLNTSFNNYAEPIVNSIDDAITCFLTSGLDYLVIDNLLIHKKSFSNYELQEMKVKIPKYIQLLQLSKFTTFNTKCTDYIMNTNYSSSYSQKISMDMFLFLSSVLKKESRISEIFESNKSLDKNSIMNEIKELWEKRFVVLEP